ncbi:MAG: TM0106 family RecB-like putative nuclease [Acidimicrobiia bacterium]|nr:TM0106 family RecB-like putative nuclease [Acidimicrobiia bacterium]
MQRIGERVLFSPSDLNHFLECRHLIRLELAREPGAPRAPRGGHADLLAEKGAEHERAWLARFRDEGRRVVAIEPAGAERDWQADAARTIAAMKAGADVIYQGVFAAGDWHGISDFLVRVERPTSLGAWGYEAWDTKLARRAKPYFVLQLCFYTAEIARIQGADPGEMVIVLGTGEHERLRYRDFAAYWRAVRGSFLEAVGDDVRTYPYPVEHCSLCDHQVACARRREEDDHLSLVAGIRRDQVERLNEAGITTVSALAGIDLGRRVGIGDVVLARLREQAALQSGFRRTGAHRYELLPVDERTGFRLLPQPSAGDLFFDIEGDPWFEPRRGLEYLFGVMTVDDGSPRFEGLRALTRDGEKRGFERFVDLVHERLERWPDLHVYHYAAYETTALRRLMSEHRTREEELDALLRREVFVDLYQVVRQSMRISHPSYSIKSVRTFFMDDAGRGAVATGGDSILEFERWRRTGDAAILDAIVDYNREDCLSTVRLRDWLLDRKAEAEQASGRSIAWKRVGESKVTEEREAADAKTAARVEALRAIGSGGAVLLADLLDYHAREAKPEWWAYFDRRKKSLDDLVDDTEAIAWLSAAGDEAPAPEKQSIVYPLDFPEQEYKLSASRKSQLEDPFRGASAGTAIRIAGDRRRLHLKRGPTLAGVPLPAAVARGRPIPDFVQRDALARLAEAVLAGGAPYPAARALLARQRPRIRGRRPGARIQTMDLDEQRALVAALDGSCLFVQGPPGSGKTWTGARLIVSLISAGQRIGVSALSHKAINNLLAEVERVARDSGVRFTGLKKCTDDDDRFDGAWIENVMTNEACDTADVSLVAGTSWLFARPAMEGRIDCLFVDEAGQLSLADTLAMATCAGNLVLLGDPQQLPQIQQGVHPGESGRSALEHLLGDAETVPEDRGIFQERTYRMHPDVCRFISDLSYEGRLRSADGCERQRVSSRGLSGAGLRYVAVEHQGNAQVSREEADAIGREVAHLLDGGTFTDVAGRTRPLTPGDILVVAPYNIQVRCLRERLPVGVEAGTVDRFQGREAPVVFYSMASSSGEDVPRGLEFLFGRNRLNVAISRARALAVLVCSSRLLETRCHSLDQMRLVNHMCRLAEDAAVGRTLTPRA